MGCGGVGPPARKDSLQSRQLESRPNCGCRRQCHPHHGGFDVPSVTNRTSVRLSQKTEALQTTTSRQNGQTGNKASAHYTSKPRGQRKSTVGSTPHPTRVVIIGPASVPTAFGQRGCHPLRLQQQWGGEAGPGESRRGDRAWGHTEPGKCSYVPAFLNTSPGAPAESVPA